MAVILIIAIEHTWEWALPIHVWHMEAHSTSSTEVHRCSPVVGTLRSKALILWHFLVSTPVSSRIPLAVTQFCVQLCDGSQWWSRAPAGREHRREEERRVRGIQLPAGEQGTGEVDNERRAARKCWGVRTRLLWSKAGQEEIPPGDSELGGGGDQLWKKYDKFGWRKTYYSCGIWSGP